MSKNKLYAGTGAICSILTRFIHPKLHNPDKDHRSIVKLISKEEKTVNRKRQVCYTFKIVCDNNTEYCAVKKHFKIEKEGNRDDFFETPPRQLESATFKEPKTKWRKSQAKKILYELIRDGTVPLHATDSNGQPMSMEDIYARSKEFA